MSDNLFTKQKDLEISVCEIIKPIGQGQYQHINILDRIVDVTIYQDIYNSVMSGKVSILDTEDLLAQVPLTGTEFFSIGIKYPDTSLTGLLDATLSFQEVGNALIENVDSIIQSIDFNKILGDFLGGFFIDFLFNNVESLPSIQNLFSTILGMTDFKRKTQHHLFRIYKADNSILVRDNAKFETFRLISPEYIWNLQTKFNRNFVGEQISSIVAAYFTELKQFFEDTHPELYNNKIKLDALQIEETAGLVNFSSTQTNPFTIINSLSSTAISNIDDSANFVFFQNNIGFNFRSLASIFSQNNQLQFFCKNPNISESKQGAFALNAMAFESMNRTQSFDIINNLREGLYGSRLLSVDPLRKKWYKTDYQLSKEFFKYANTQNDASASNLQIEQDFEGMDQINARQMLLQSSLGHDTEPYLKALDNTMIDEKVEHVSQLRSSQMRLMEQAKTYVKLPGHPSINAGLKCQFNMPNFNILDSALRSKYLQGSYVITSCAHHINRYNYMVEAEIVKTDFFTRINFVQT